MDLHQAQQALISRLRTIYDEREAALIADWVMEHLTGWKKIDRLVRKTEPVSQKNQDLLQQYLHELLAHRPVQYVLHESFFCGMKFYVDEHVLIPRPETEELVEWVVEDYRNACTILDVGTGSGCIAISLQKKLAAPAPAIRIHACDISKEALTIAQRNATANQASVQFHQLDFLDPGHWPALPPVDTLVSNPPYIPLRDKAAMARHVTDFEPHLALFVDNNDPLIFYKAIARFAQQKLPRGGSLYVEIHEELGGEVKKVFQDANFQHIILKQDMQGRDRFVKAATT